MPLDPQAWQPNPFECLEALRHRENKLTNPFERRELFEELKETTYIFDLEDHVPSNYDSFHYL